MKLVPIAQNGALAIAAEDPSGSLPGVLEQTVGLYQRRGFLPPWTVYVGEEQGTFVGTCGFAGPPACGEAEIAYFTFPGQEGRRVATRMASALLSQTSAAAALLGVAFTAHTLPQDGPSTRILRRLGFTLLGKIAHPEDGEIWKWRKSETA